MFHIILHQPEIPQNTGSIGRLCVCTGCKLHLIQPLGFKVTDYYLRRAGLDYWEKLAPSLYASWHDFLAKSPAKRLWFASTKGTAIYSQINYLPGDGFVLGRETKGLPSEILTRHSECLIKIPMPGDFHRSLNQAQAAAVVLYEALRQANGW
ncbi:MAG: tRNA (cytidine(34)-2'-O)-methyltransferase [Holophagaceae bacterium]|nr:tRNA (cytidine(34)-2'-O)-methyltransferase [Holophagaceae bacterium]